MTRLLCFWVKRMLGRADEPHGFKLEQNLMRAVIDVNVCRFYAQFGGFGNVIGIGDPGEFLDFAFAREFVEPLAVTAFAFFDRGGNVHFDESTKGFDVLAHGAAGCGIGRDWRANCDPTVFGDFGGDIADTANVQIAVFLGESEFR